MDAAALMQAVPRPSWAPWTPLAALECAVLANEAMLLGQITTPLRAAMFLAQIGAESESLQYMQEVGSAAYLQGQPYYPYIGRTFIQVTWSFNYLAFGEWCHSKGLIADQLAFVKDPASLADPMWSWLGPVWYWTVARSGLNAAADQGDIVLATQLINGGLNGLADRQSRYALCLSLGAAIVPTPAKDWFDMATLADLDAVVTRRLNERFNWWLPRLVGLLRTGRGNAGFSPANCGPLVDNIGVDGEVARLSAQITELTAVVDAIRAKDGA